MIDLILLLLVSHVLGDFYFQSHDMSIKKTKYMSMLFIHSIIYGATMQLPFFLCEFSIYMLLVSLLIAVAHFIIDLGVYYINKKGVYENFKHWLFITDQIAHIAVIAVLVIVFKSMLEMVDSYPFISQNVWALKWIAVILFAAKPGNIVFKKLFSIYRPDAAEDDTENERMSAGGVIGILERILALICIVQQAYACIGLILTAKSIARYDKISKNPRFAEYYLIGTLSSLLYTIAVYAGIFILV